MDPDWQPDNVFAPDNSFQTFQYQRTEELKSCGFGRDYERWQSESSIDHPQSTLLLALLWKSRLHLSGVHFFFHWRNFQEKHLHPWYNTHHYSWLVECSTAVGSRTCVGLESYCSALQGRTLHKNVTITLTSHHSADQLSSFVCFWSTWNSNHQIPDCTPHTQWGWKKFFNLSRSRAQLMLRWQCQEIWGMIQINCFKVLNYCFHSPSLVMSGAVLHLTLLHFILPGSCHGAMWAMLG